MLSQMSGFPSFLRLNNIPVYIYATFSLPIHLLMDRCFHILATEYCCNEHRGTDIMIANFMSCVMLSLFYHN